LIAAALAAGSMIGTSLFGALMEYYGLNAAYLMAFILISSGALLTVYVHKAVDEK